MERTGQGSFSKLHLISPNDNDSLPIREGFPISSGDQFSLEAGRFGYEQSLDQMTIAEFVKSKFLPDHIQTKRASGKRHYKAILKHVIPPEEVDEIFEENISESKSKLKFIANWPYMNNVRLRDAHPDHVEGLVSAALDSGYSTQTAKHIRNVVGAIFSHAIKAHYFTGENPAIMVAPPRMTRREAHTLTLEQTVRVLQVMRYPEMEMALLVLLTGMNVAEICGLQWMDVNLARHSVNRGGEFIPPMTVAVRNQWYRGELSSVPGARRKYIFISQLLYAMFLRLGLVTITYSNDFVLISRGGRPINQINIAARRLKSIGGSCEVPWLSWQVFRRTRRSLIQEFGAQLPERLAEAIAANFEPKRNSTIPQGPNRWHR